MSKNETKKVVYIFDSSDIESRLLLAQKAKAKNMDVVLVLIGDIKKQHTELDNFSIYKVPSEVRTFRAPTLLKIAKRLAQIIKKEQPDLIHAVTLKYGFLMGLAAAPYKNTNKIITLAGLGYLFRGENFKASLVRTFIAPVLKKSLNAPNTKLIFQNQDDLDLMVTMNFARKEHCHLIKSSGVFLERFSSQHISEVTKKSNDNDLIVLMPTRLVKEKGVHIFVEAARKVHDKFPDVKFQIAGGLTQHNPRAYTQDEILNLTSDGVVEWLGHVDDLPARLSQAAFVVYPSYYGEGVPRVMIEACAAGCPIITTDHAGCRETVDDGENGILVPVKDAFATASAMEKLLNDPDLRKKMSAASRKKAQAEFDIHKVSEATLALY